MLRPVTVQLSRFLQHILKQTLDLCICIGAAYSHPSARIYDSCIAPAELAESAKDSTKYALDLSGALIDLAQLHKVKLCTPSSPLFVS